jgi:preprotein translocase subunit Sec61beta
MDGMPRNTTPRRAGRRVGATILVAAMVIAALSMWTVIPLGWVWIGSQVSNGQAPSGGPYMVVLVGIVISILVISWVLGRLNRVYLHLTGSTTVEPIRPPWLKSLRDSEAPKAYPSVLETVIVTSVILAILSMTAWFFILAGSPLPSQ